MSLDRLMAPLIVLAPRFGRDAQGRPEYREHHEIVLYNQGFNDWHYTWRDNRLAWHLAAYLRAPFAAKTRLLKFGDSYYGELNHYGMYWLGWADVRRRRI